MARRPRRRSKASARRPAKAWSRGVAVLRAFETTASRQLLDSGTPSGTLWCNPAKTAASESPIMPSLLEFLQQNAAIFGTLTGVVAVLGLAFSIYKASHDSRV